MAKRKLFLPFGYGHIGIGVGKTTDEERKLSFPSVNLEVYNEPHEIGEDLMGKEGEYEIVLVFEKPDGIDMLIKALNDCKAL